MRGNVKANLGTSLTGGVTCSFVAVAKGDNGVTNCKFVPWSAAPAAFHRIPLLPSGLLRGVSPG
jgi:hypothetical protein